jgi:nitrate reductase NapAB chaperone NapD
MDGAQVHDHDPMGKIIVTAEGETHRQISIITDNIRDMQHVVDVAAVYHEYEQPEQANASPKAQETQIEQGEHHEFR